MIISDLCNQNCNFCSYRIPEGFSSANFVEELADGKINVNPNRQIPKEKCFEILDDCAAMGVKAIQFTGGGEPTAHKDHVEIFNYAHELGLETALVSNGVILRDLPTYAGMTWVRISLDAGTEETYESTRQSKAWKGVIRNLMELSTIQDHTVVGVGFVVTKYNCHEIHAACEIVKDVGISNIRLSAIFSEDRVNHFTSQDLTIISDQIKKAKLLESDKFSVIDNFHLRTKDLMDGAPDYGLCGYQRFTTYIGGDQKIYRCCTTSYTDHGEIGDLKDKSFRYWFEHEALGQYGGFDPKTCHTCQFNNQNKAIENLITVPPHGNFV